MKQGKAYSVNFLDAVNQLIMYYNKQQYSKVVNLYEGIFKMSGIDEEKMMTKKILIEPYVVSAFSYVQLCKYDKALEILNYFDMESLEGTIDKDLFYMIPLCLHQIHMYRKNYNKQLEYAEKLLELNPQLYTNSLRRGFACINLKRYGEAEKDFITALENGGLKDSQIYINLIVLYMETKKFKEALKYIETACNLFKETEFEFLLYFMKIGVLIKLEDFQKAAETIDLIYDIVPDNRPKYKIALMRIEGKSYSEAYDIIYEQVEKFTEDPRSGA